MSDKIQRGFAKMDPEKRKAIASMGGKAAHKMGRAHEFDSTKAKEAGKKGGREAAKNREHMAAIGRKGGKARAAKAALKKALAADTPPPTTPTEGSPETIN